MTMTTARRKRAEKSARAASRQRRQERGRQRGRSREGLLGSFAGAGRAGPGLSGQAGVDLILYGLGWSQRHQLLTTRRFRPLSPKGIAGPPYLRVAGAPRLNAEVAKAPLDRVLTIVLSAGEKVECGDPSEDSA